MCRRRRVANILDHSQRQLRWRANNEMRIVKRGKGLIYFSRSLDYYTGEEDVAARGSADLNVTREYFRLRVVEDGYKLKWDAEPLAWRNSFGRHAGGEVETQRLEGASLDD